MAVTRRRSRSISWTVVAAVLASTVLMNYPFAMGHSAAHSSAGLPGVWNTPSAAQQSGPLSITPSLDTGRAVTATMDSTGGTLSVTAANGTNFILSVPPDALVSEEDITMTPVAAIPDLPFSQGLAAGGAVQLAPEGLLLVKSASLTIQPTSPIFIDEQSPFAWYNSGEDFQLFPLDLDLTSLTIDVDHFNGYGIGVGSSADRDAVASHTPSRSEAQFTQLLEQQTEALRQKLSQGLTKKQAKKANKKYNAQVLDDFVSALTDLDKQLGKDLGSGGSGVAPQSRLQDATPGGLRCDLLNILVGLINMRARGLTIADLGGVGSPGLAAHIKSALDALVTDSVARCQQGNVGEIGTLLGLGRFALILSALDPSLAGLSQVARNIYDTATNCAQLKITFDSTITQVPELSPGVQVQIELEATDVRLTPVLSGIGNGIPFFTGSAPLIHHIDSITNGSKNPCSFTDSSTNTTLKIISLEFKIHLRLVECPGSDATPPTDLDLWIDTQQPLENFTMTCPPPAPGFSTPGNTDIWRAQFYCEHNVGTSNHQATVFHFTNWLTTAETTLPALKLFQNVVPAVCPAYSEFTVIRVEKAD